MDDEGAVPYESKERRRKAAGQGETDHGVAPGPAGKAQPLVELAGRLVATSPFDVHYHVAGGPGQEGPAPNPSEMPDCIQPGDNVVVFLEQVGQIGDQMPSRLATYGQTPVGQRHDVPRR